MDPPEADAADFLAEATLLDAHDDTMTNVPSVRFLKPAARPTVVLGSLGLLAVLASCQLSAQDLISPDDLVAAEVPTPDARIAYGDDPLHFANLRLPAGPGPHPVLVNIHGGCFLSMFDIAHAAPAEEALSEAGFAVWSIEYRRVGDPGGGWPNTFLDVAAGIDHLRTVAATHDLDLERVYAVGHSVGASLALWAAARARIPRSSEVHTDDPMPIQGVLGLAPAPTHGALHAANVCGGVIDRLYGGSPDEYPARYDATSPMRLMPVGVEQRLVIGALDRSWAPVGRAYFEAALADGRSPITMVEAPDAGHFEVIAPWTSAWPIVLQELRTLTGGS